MKFDKDLPKRTPKHVKRAVKSGVIGYNHYPNIQETKLGSSAFSRYEEVYRINMEGYSNPNVYVLGGIIRINNSQGESALELVLEGDEDTSKEAAEILEIHAKPKKSKRRIGVDIYLGNKKLDKIDKEHYGILKEYAHD